MLLTTLEKLVQKIWYPKKFKNWFKMQRNFLKLLQAQLGLACKATSRACAKAGIAGLFGMAGEQNSSGDDQKKAITQSHRMSPQLVIRLL